MELYKNWISRHHPWCHFRHGADLPDRGQGSAAHGATDAISHWSPDELGLLQDGTLTKEGALDYAAMYTRAGAPEGCKNILEWVESLDDGQRRKANQAIREVEREGYARTEVNDKCLEMLEVRILIFSQGGGVPRIFYT